MRYYRYDLDQIAVVLDLTARALSLSLSILFVRSPFLPLAFSSFLTLFRPFYLLSQAG